MKLTYGNFARIFLFPSLLASLSLAVQVGCSSGQALQSLPQDGSTTTTGTGTSGNGTTGNAGIAPVAPTSLSESNLASTSFTLQWSDSDNSITEFLVNISTNNGWSTKGTVTVSASNNGNFSYDVTGLTPGTQYSFEVVAENNSGVTDSASFPVTTPGGSGGSTSGGTGGTTSGTTGGTTGGATPPSAPSGFAGHAASPTRITLTWTESSTVDGFSVEMAPNGDSFDPGQAVTVGASSLTYDWSGLDPNAIYLFRIRAHAAAGYSDYSSLVAVQTAPPWACADFSPLDGLYHQILGREPDSSGISVYASGMALGTMGIVDVESSLRASQEYNGKTGGGDYFEDLNALYEVLWGEFADGGYGYWHNNGLTLRNASDWMISVHGTNQYTCSASNPYCHPQAIDELFARVLGRSPSSVAEYMLATDLITGKNFSGQNASLQMVGIRELEQQMVGYQEYRANGGNEGENVINAYKLLLGRYPTSTELGTALGQLNNGTSMATFTSTLYNSSEFKSRTGCN